MINRYIVKTRTKELLSFYYNDEGMIYCRSYLGDKWQKVVPVIDGVRGDYTVNISDKGEVILLCQGINGDILLCEKKEGKWGNRVILKNSSGTSPNIMFNALIEDSSMRLLYNLPENKEQYITSQELNNNGRWSSAEKIDKFVPFGYEMFDVYRVDSGKSLVVYQKNHPETQLGYREVIRNRIGEFKSVYNTGYGISGHSMIAEEQNLHFLIIVKNRFVCRLVYVRKGEGGVREPKVIWEGCGIRECSIVKLRDKLYLFWVINKQLYYTVSKDSGSKFETVEKYHGGYVDDMVTAKYIDAGETAGELVLNEVLVDRDRPYEVQGTSDILNEIYPEKAEIEHEAVHIAQEQVATITPQLNILREEIEKLQNRVNMNGQLIEEKDNRILILTEALKRKNEEMLNNERSLRNKYKNLLEENKKLREKMAKINEEAEKIEEGGECNNENQSEGDQE